MRNWILGACLLAVIVAGTWLVALYDLGQTMYEFESALQAVGPGRGGIAPAEEEVEARVLEIAEEQGVEVSEIYVSVEPLTRANMDRAGAMTSIVQGRIDEAMQGADAPLPGVASESSGLTAELEDDRAMTITGTLIEIEVHARAEKWMWSAEEDFTAAITLR